MPSIDFFRGHGRLAGERKVVVTDKEGAQTNLTARHAVVVCTGTRALVPDVPGLAEARPWTNREAVGARTVPRRLAILGGGVVACEMATLWKQLGTDEITVIQRGTRLIPKNEPFAGDLLRASFEQRGISVLTGTTVRRVERQHDGVVHLSLSNGKTLLADEVLAATGRLPSTQDMGLGSVDLKPGGWLEVDESMRVKEVPGGWLYAAGDVNHLALLTHMGKYQARVCGDVIAARAKGKPEASAPGPWTQYSATANTCAVPQVIFSDPEIAAVGLTEARGKSPWDDCANQSITRLAKFPGAALYADDYKGHARMVIDQTRGVLVGMTLIGPSVGELIHAATIAIVGAVPISRLWHAVPSFPTHQ